MLPKLKEYLNRPSIRNLIEDEQYTQVLYHMELDNHYDLIPFYVDLLFECGADITSLNYSGSVEELQRFLDSELPVSVKVVVSLATPIEYDASCNTDSLIYAFIYNDRCYSGAVEIVYDNTHERDWDDVFEECSYLIVSDFNARIHDGDFVVRTY